MDTTKFCKVRCKYRCQERKKKGEKKTCHVLTAN